MRNNLIYKIALLCVLVLAAAKISAQVNETGIPFYENYSPELYKASEQNWAIEQDNRGVMYFGNNDNGVLEYDGINWKSIPIANESIVRSLAKDEDGTIIVGAVGDFGYLEPDEKGELLYVSLSAELDSSDRQFGNVWKTHINNDTIYFCTLNEIFVYHKKEFVKKISIYERYSFFTFLIKNRLVLGNFLKGLMEISGDSMIVVNGGEFYTRKNIVSIIPYSNHEWLVATMGNGIFMYNTITGQSYEALSFNNSLKKVLGDLSVNENNLYCGISIPNGKYAFGTLGSGVLTFNRKGEMLQHLKKANSMIDDVVTCLYDNDPYQPLWASLNNGIYKAQINSPIRFFGEKDGIKGSVSDIYRHNGTLFVATTSGVFYMDYENGIPLFRQIENIFSAQCFFSFKSPRCPEGKLLVGTQLGLFEIRDNKAIQLEENSINFIKEAPDDYVYQNIYMINQSRKNPEKLFVGSHEFLSLEYLGNDRWQELFLLPHERMNDDEVRSIQEDEDGRIWLGLNFKGIFRIDLNDRDTVIHSFNLSHGLPSLRTNFVSRDNRGILFLTTQGLYRYDEQSNRFIRDCDYHPSFCNEKKGVFRYTSNNKGTFWFSLSDNPDSTSKTEYIPKKWMEALIINKDGTVRKDSAIFAQLPNLSFEAIYCDNTTTWIGNSAGIFSYTPEIDFDNWPLYKALIRKTVVGRDSVVFYGTYYTETNNGLIVSSEQPDKLVLELPYNLNDITFHFAAPFFDDESAIRFRYFLEGFDDKWSNWGEEHYKDFTNLSEGNYAFYVEAKNIYGQVSERGIFRFRIYPPWYRTVWAYISYFVLSIFLIIVIVKLYTRKLEKEKIRLEGIVKERTAEVVRQKEDIEKKNEILETQKVEIERKNETLEKQKEEITLQRDHIATINQELTDSIHYAERIQKAILPHEDFANEILPEHFILFKPKDIVSGDFYWAGKIDNWIFATAADCTGHGVPGAFMSMLGVAFLNEIVKDKEVSCASQVLDRLRGHIIKSLQQTGKEGEQKDGMDISFSAINIDTKELQWAGANNPLYFIRRKQTEQDVLVTYNNGAEEIHEPNMSSETHHLFEIKPDKMPIAIYLKMDPFKNITINLQKGDCIYMFTDGFADQFGGADGKKFKYKPFKKIILENQDNPIELQKELLDNAIEGWKAFPDPISGHDHYEQIDDICVIGLKF